MALETHQDELAKADKSCVRVGSVLFDMKLLEGLLTVVASLLLLEGYSFAQAGAGSSTPQSQVEKMPVIDDGGTERCTSPDFAAEIVAKASNVAFSASNLHFMIIQNINMAASHPAELMNSIREPRDSLRSIKNLVSDAWMTAACEFNQKGHIAEAEELSTRLNILEEQSGKCEVFQSFGTSNAIRQAKHNARFFLEGARGELRRGSEACANLQLRFTRIKNLVENISSERQLQGARLWQGVFWIKEPGT